MTLVDREARQKAVTVKITGAELETFERAFRQASDRARELTAVSPKPEDISDLAALAVAFAQAHAAATAMYVVTGSSEWHARAETGWRGYTRTMVDLRSKERELLAIVSKYATVEAARPNMPVLNALVTGEKSHLG